MTMVDSNTCLQTPIQKSLTIAPCIRLFKKAQREIFCSISLFFSLEYVCSLSYTFPPWIIHKLFTNNCVLEFNRTECMRIQRQRWRARRIEGSWVTASALYWNLAPIPMESMALLTLWILITSCHFWVQSCHRYRPATVTYLYFMREPPRLCYVYRNVPVANEVA